MSETRLRMSADDARPAPWLVVIDMQRIFGEPDSPWCAPDYAVAAAGVQRLLPAFGNRVAYTRFQAPSEPPHGAWVPYYSDWPFALEAAGGPLYDLTDGFDVDGHPVVDRETFGKWDDELAGIVGAADVYLVGVSTDCCVLSTALVAADQGVPVLVVADACAGVSEADHQRALDAMAMYAPLIRITDTAAVLTTLDVAGTVA